MITSGLTKRNIAYLLVTMAVTLSTASAEKHNHIRARPVGENMKKKLAPVKAARNTVKSARKLKSDKDKEPDKLETTFSVGFHEEYADMSGWVKIEINGDDEMEIEYTVSSGPEKCTECHFAILDSGSCDKTGKDALYEAGDDADAADPWTDTGDAAVTTTSGGDGAGMMTGVVSGHGFSDNHCKIIVVKGPLPDDDDDGPGSGSRKRKLKSKADDGSKVLLCGQLHKPGMTDDC